MGRRPAAFRDSGVRLCGAAALAMARTSTEMTSSSCTPAEVGPATNVTILRAWLGPQSPTQSHSGAPEIRMNARSPPRDALPWSLGDGWQYCRRKAARIDCATHMAMASLRSITRDSHHTSLRPAAQHGRMGDSEPPRTLGKDVRMS
jgi:hypothetical protein